MFGRAPTPPGRCLTGVNAELPAAKDPHDAPTSGEGHLRHP